MVRKCGDKMAKWLLWAFNFVFVVCGIVMISVGAGCLAKLSPGGYFYKGLLGAPIFLIIVGVTVFFIAFLGCCGSWKENGCMITTFMVFLVVILICELGAGIAAYAYKGQVKQVVNDALETSLDLMQKNGTDAPELRKIWDDMQMSLHCCGAVNGTQDWISRNLPLPSSCCRDKEGPCTEPLAQKTHCDEGLQDLFKDNIVPVGAAAIIICFIEIVGIIFACCLRSAIREKYESV